MDGFYSFCAFHESIDRACGNDFFFQKETFEAVRNYAESIKKLLGISQLLDQKPVNTSA